jgi:hypothetical protein
MTKPEAHTNEMRCCYLIFASIEDMHGSNGAPFSTSYLGDTADMIFGCGAGTTAVGRYFGAWGGASFFRGLRFFVWGPATFMKTEIMG